MGQMITLHSDTPIGAYLAEPAAVSRGGIVVIQEIFGINIHIRDVADRIAAAGYTAIAPALFDSVQPGVELGYEADGISQGVGLKNQVGFERPLRDVAAAAREAGRSARHRLRAISAGRSGPRAGTKRPIFIGLFWASLRDTSARRRMRLRSLDPAPHPVPIREDAPKRDFFPRRSSGRPGA